MAITPRMNITLTDYEDNEDVILLSANYRPYHLPHQPLLTLSRAFLNISLSLLHSGKAQDSWIFHAPPAQSNPVNPRK